MRTVSTKLDKKDHEKFIDLCNHEGCSASEALRDMIQQWCGTVENNFGPGKEADHQKKPQPTMEIIDDKKPIPELKIKKIIPN